MSATTRPREGVHWEPAIGPTRMPAEADSESAAGRRGRLFLEDQRTRRLQGRLVRFAIFIPLWLLAIIPLAREVSEGREVVLAYLAVGAVSLGIGLALRGVYVLLMRRKHIWAPSAFLIAAVLALASYVVQTGGEKEIPITAAAQESEVRGSSG